jgi:Predicted membrane protein (DUF2177)
MVGRIYRPALGNVLAATVNLPPTIVFSLIYPVGLMIFAISPGLKSGSVAMAAIYGALFGFFTYATHDLSNLATLRNWTLHHQHCMGHAARGDDRRGRELCRDQVRWRDVGRNQVAHWMNSARAPRRRRKHPAAWLTALSSLRHGALNGVGRWRAEP